MSYILEALRKAEQQREIGQVPGIGSEHEKTSVVAGRRWLWVFIAVLMVNSGLLVYVFWPAEKPESVAPAGPAEVFPEAGRLPAPKVALPAARVPVQPKPVTIPPVVKPIQAEVARVETGQPQVPLRPLKPLPEPVRERITKPPGSVQPGILPAESAGQRQAPQPAANSNNNLPVWPQVSAQLFQQVRGGLRLDVHVYSKLQQERFVLINMQKYNQGQQLQEGPVVDEITPEGVILSYQGRRFRLRSQ